VVRFVVTQIAPLFQFYDPRGGRSDLAPYPFLGAWAPDSADSFPQRDELGTKDVRVFHCKYGGGDICLVPHSCSYRVFL